MPSQREKRGARGAARTAEDRKEAAVAERLPHLLEVRGGGGPFARLVALAQVGHTAQRAPAADQNRDEDQRPAEPGELDVAFGVELPARNLRRGDEEHRERERGKAESAEIAEEIAQPEQPGALRIIVGQFRRHRAGRNLERADRHAGERGEREDPEPHLHVAEPGWREPREDEEGGGRQRGTEDEGMTPPDARTRHVGPAADERIGKGIDQQCERDRARDDRGGHAEHLVVEQQQVGRERSVLHPVGDRAEAEAEPVNPRDRRGGGGGQIWRGGGSGHRATPPPR